MYLIKDMLYDIVFFLSVPILALIGIDVYLYINKRIRLYKAIQKRKRK